jgi:hypothetical protein
MTSSSMLPEKRYIMGRYNIMFCHIHISDDKNEKKDTISYVVINPGYDLQLKLGDVV